MDLLHDVDGRERLAHVPRALVDAPGALGDGVQTSQQGRLVDTVLAARPHQDLDAVDAVELRVEPARGQRELLVLAHPGDRAGEARDLLGDPHDRQCRVAALRDVVAEARLDREVEVDVGNTILRRIVAVAAVGVEVAEGGLRNRVTGDRRGSGWKEQLPFRGQLLQTQSRPGMVQLQRREAERPARSTAAQTAGTVALEARLLARNVVASVHVEQAFGPNLDGVGLVGVPQVAGICKLARTRAEPNQHPGLHAPSIDLEFLEQGGPDGHDPVVGVCVVDGFALGDVGPATLFGVVRPQLIGRGVLAKRRMDLQRSDVGIQDGVGEQLG